MGFYQLKKALQSAGMLVFAHPDIGEAHSDTSSGAAEVYSAANATHEILELSYAADDAGIEFPQPAILQMNNAAAEAFTNNSSIKSNTSTADNNGSAL
jgi:hypothetical protein